MHDAHDGPWARLAKVPWDAGARGKAVLGPEVWGDLRFLALAGDLGLASAVEAVGYVAQVWAWQGAYHTDERSALVVPVEVVATILGRRWPAALVRCDLAQPDRAADGSPGLRFAGTDEHVRLATRDRRAASAGSRAATQARRAKRAADGGGGLRK